MILVCDVGNTNIVFGVFDKNSLLLQFRISTFINRSSDEYAVIILSILRENEISKNDINNILIASVVPPLLFHLKNTFRKYFKILPNVLSSGDKFGIKNLYNPPEHVGIDRIINSVSGFEKYKQALIIIDFGTATTFDVISSKGEYIGGVITPGIKIAKEALFLNTSKLPKVEIERPPSIVGTTTIHSIQSGLTYGYAALVDGIVNKIKNEYKKEKFKVLATGGLASIIDELSETIEIVEKDLTLNGLNIIFNKRNKNEF